MQHYKDYWQYYLSAVFWLVTVGFWLVLWFFNPYSDSGEITSPGILMFSIAMLAILASIFRQAIVLFIFSLISFFPFGLYFLGSPGIFSVIGVLNILCIALAIYLLFKNIKRRKSN